MHKQLTLAALLAASFGTHAAGDADLAAIRAQIAEMKQSYEQRIAQLEQRLAQAEAGARSAASQTNAVPAVQVAETAVRQIGQSAASAFNPEVSLILQGQYRNMNDIAERGISGFFAAGGHDHGNGSIEPGSRRGFSVDHTELVLAANIDPYWRGQAIIAALDGTAEVEEAWFQSHGLGNGLGLKGGRFRSGIGYLNEQHPHMWDFADAPLAYQAMFGTHGSFANDGVQFKWLAPTDTFIELGAEIGRGANYPGSERNKNGSGASAIFAHVGGELGVANQWRAGLSYLNTRPKDRQSHLEDAVNGVEALGSFSGTSRTWMADFVWKWAPDGNPKYQNFKFQTEYFQRREKGDLACVDADVAAPASCSGNVEAFRSRQSGWYAQGVYQFSPNWRAGLRYEKLDSGVRDFGVALNAAAFAVDAYQPQKTSAMVDYSWSEFSRVRLQIARDKSMRDLAENQLTLQYIMSLGAHGAHKF